MTAPLVTHRRPWVPLVNMLVAAAAFVIAVIALASAPAETVTIPQTPAAAVVAQAPAATPAALPAIDGCVRIRGFHPC